MEKCIVKLVVFNDDDFGYWKNRTHKYLITTALGRNVYDRVSHLETDHDVWLKLCNTYEGSSKIKSSRRDTYNRQYQTFSQKPGESLDDCFALSLLSVAYVLVVLLLTLTMNLLKNFSMRLMILFGA
jgi:hypothetical protein